MAGTLDGILASRRADGRDVTALSMRLLSTSLPLLVGVVLALPLAMLLANSFNVSAAGQPARFGFANWQAAVADPSAVGALWNSFALAIVRTAISLPVALVLTWLVARTDMPGRGVIELLAWLSIFVPILPLAFGWVLILDAKFGLLNALISSITGSRTAVAGRLRTISSVDILGVIIREPGRQP